uniref:Uncharacterized protein n=1 Tax=Arundo donax TaxID=35708 RepID=A0A0A9BUA1_ARUDO
MKRSALMMFSTQQKWYATYQNRRARFSHYLLHCT